MKYSKEHKMHEARESKAQEYAEHHPKGGKRISEKQENVREKKKKVVERMPKKLPSLASQIRAEKKAKRIAKLVTNAPEGSALRPWSYEKRKYL